MITKLFIEATKITTEKINYMIFFVAAIAILSTAILIEKPESLANAIPSQDTEEEPAGDGDGETNDTDVKPTQQDTEEEPAGDGDGETNDD